MTEYGKVVRSLMANRGLANIRQLHRRLVEEGHDDFSYWRVRNALSKRWVARGRPPKLNLAIAEVLGLDTDEMIRMALADMATD